MSRHWNPDEELGRVAAARQRPSRQWPQGATAGVTMVAVACVGLGVLLYKLAGPRDIFGQ